MWNRAKYTATEPRLGECPFGIALAAGFATAVLGCLLTSLASAPDEDTPRLVEVSLITAGFAAVLRNPAAALLTAGMTWSFYLGFLVEHAGELRWHGGVDLLRLGTLVAAALLGSARWPIAGLLSARSAAVPSSREELRLAVIGEPAHERTGAPTPPAPARRHRSQAGHLRRRGGRPRDQATGNHRFRCS